jgi:hypothetical protein
MDCPRARRASRAAVRRSRPNSKLKLRETGEHASHHPACGVRCVDAFAKGTQHDPALAKLTDGRHNLSGVTAQASALDRARQAALGSIADQLRTATEKDPDQNGWSGPVICDDASRGGGIRTHDLFVPNEARYQAAPHPA